MELSLAGMWSNSSFSLGRWKCFQFSHPVSFMSSDISNIAKAIWSKWLGPVDLFNSTQLYFLAFS
jgi:hypothetical protein